MTTSRKLLWGGLGMLALMLVCCLGVLLGSALSKDETGPTETVVAVGPAATNTPVEASSTVPTATPTAVVIVVTATPRPTMPSPDPTPTPVPTLPPPDPTPTSVPPVQPSGPAQDLKALVAYAEVIKPTLDEGLAAAKRDGDILEASKENPEALCGGGLAPHPTLLADAALMDSLVERLKEIVPPAEAADPVHKPLVESVRFWGDALDNINLSCQTGDPAAQGLLRLGAVLQLGGSMLNFRIASDNFWRMVLVNGIEAIIGTPPAP